MELLVWRWSTAVQATSLVLIALFFAALVRSVRLDEVRWWARAWWCNLAALTVTLAFWYLGLPEPVVPVAFGLYMAAKTTFVVLLLHGGRVLKHPGARLPSAAVGGLVAYGLVCMATVRTIPAVGLVQHGTMAILLALGSAALLRSPGHPALRWLAPGLLVRFALAVLEAAAYATQLAPAGAVSPALLGRTGFVLAAHSSFDSGAEWLLALGCVLAVSERVQRELRQANEDLLAAQEDLRRLADRDPLTALANRRALPEALRAVQPRGALLLFFDLDGFKEINDRHGHQVGDECLRRFGAALRESFRPTDVLVRYAGDEFLVVAPDLDDAAADDRIARVRDRLREGGGLEVSFSAGRARLEPGGYPDEALRAADASMYSAKRDRLERGAARTG